MRAKPGIVCMATVNHRNGDTKERSRSIRDHANMISHQRMNPMKNAVMAMLSVR